MDTDEKKKKQWIYNNSKGNVSHRKDKRERAGRERETRRDAPRMREGRSKSEENMYQFYTCRTH